MQNAATLKQRLAGDYAGHRLDLSDAVVQLLWRVFGCWHRQMSRPFTREGRSYRVCLSCGMTRDFDTATWKTFGPYRCRS